MKLVFIFILFTGLYNTLKSLLPPHIANKSYYRKLCDELKPGLYECTLLSLQYCVVMHLLNSPGVAAMNVFLGLNASAEELGIKRQNMWAFNSNNLDKEALDYFNMNVDQVFFNVVH